MQDARISVIEKPSLERTLKMDPFKVGDTVTVQVRIIESPEKSRLQAFKGVVIARKNAGINSSFTVRKHSYGIGVERVFPLYSQLVDSVKCERKGKVRQSKIYYMRQRSGKSARIAERLETKRS